MKLLLRLFLTEGLHYSLSLIPIQGDLDYTVDTAEVTASYNRLNLPSYVMLSFHVDKIAQEPNETLTLHLTPLEMTTLPTGNGVFFRHSTDIIIADSDSKKIRLAFMVSYSTLDYAQKHAPLRTETFYIYFALSL